MNMYLPTFKIGYNIASKNRRLGRDNIFNGGSHITNDAFNVNKGKAGDLN